MLQPSVTGTAIEVEGVSKRYRLGQFNARTLREEFQRLFRRTHGAAAGRETPEATEFWALKDISFSVQRGEVLGIIGRNGAGKSTLLKILSRITEPTAGEIRVRGRVASLLEVGTGFHPELTGRENIYLNGAILGMRRREIAQKFDEIVTFAEVEKFLDTPVKRYSSGMYVRLAFAVAAHLDPEILIVDEVLAVGDAEFQKKCLGKMKDVSARAGRTVIFVSHNMQAVTNLCDTAIFLANGMLISRGSSREMVSEYVKANLSHRIDQNVLCWDQMCDAPGNDEIKIHRVRIESSDTHAIFLSSEIKIEIMFWNLSSKNVMLDLVLYTSDGSPLLEDWSADDPQWRGRRIPKGLIKTTCTIPPYLLNEGTFRIRMMFFDGDAVMPIFDFDDDIFFDVIDTADRAVGFHGKFLGPVRPKLGWTINLVSEVV
jgi:lipopolysaccharide transport system ATP-binding protein